MAKKKTPAPAPVPAKRGAPMKTCPKCQAEQHARKGQCDCGYVFETAPKSPKTAKTTRKTGGGNLTISDAIALIRSMGGLSALRDALETYEKASEIVEAMGGVEATRELVDFLADYE